MRLHHDGIDVNGKPVKVYRARCSKTREGLEVNENGKAIVLRDDGFVRRGVRFLFRGPDDVVYTIHVLDDPGREGLQPYEITHVRRPDFERGVALKDSATRIRHQDSIYSWFKRGDGE
jgi:hypothetical protein